MDPSIALALRIAHLLTAALWIGATAILTLFVMPSIRRSGASGGPVIVETMRRGLGIYMASTAGLTILSGAALFWARFHAAGADALHSTAGTLLSLGAVAGVVAMIIGGAVLGRTSRELAALAAAPPTEATAARTAELHRRGASVSKLTLALLVGALLLMVLSRSF